MRIIILIVMTVAIAAGVYYLGRQFTGKEPKTDTMSETPDTMPADAFRIGLVPEQDIYVLRRSYQGLTKYLSSHLGRPVVLVTLNSYEAVLKDFKERQIDAAFLGSLVAVLAMDREGAKVLVKPETPDGVSTYRGVIFVRADSPAQKIEDLKGRSIAKVRTTTAGSLFPFAELRKRGMLEGPDAPRFVRMGTHDDVVAAVAAGKVDAGAAKDLRIQAFQAEHPEQKMRWIAISEAVPNNALVVRGDVADKDGARIKEILLAMDKDPAGREALAALRAARFVPCAAEQYKAVYDMIEAVGPAWSRTAITGVMPVRTTAPTTREAGAP